MKSIAKVIAVFINLSTYSAGVTTLIIKLLEKEYFAVVIPNGFNYNETLFFNLGLFTLGSALLGIVLLMFIGEYEKKEVTVEYPIIWAILPVLIGIAFLYFGITGAPNKDAVTEVARSSREIVIMVVSSVVYIAASLVNIYSGTKVFTLFPKKDKE